MKCYLDTNVLIFALFAVDLKNSIDKKTEDFLQDGGNSFFISSVVLHEVLHLVKIGKITKSKKYRTKDIDVFSALEIAQIKVNYITEKHYKFYTTKLHIDKYVHRDPFDHLIIAQAISDKIALISTDNDFPAYETQGLKLVKIKPKGKQK